MIKVNTVLCRAGSMDNYSYLITDKETGISAVIDPSETAPIVAACKELAIKPSFVLNTHHHFDHTDSNPGHERNISCRNHRQQCRCQKDSGLRPRRKPRKHIHAGKIAC